MWHGQWLVMCIRQLWPSAGSPFLSTARSGSTRRHAIMAAVWFRWNVHTVPQRKWRDGRVLQVIVNIGKWINANYPVRALGE